MQNMKMLSVGLLVVLFFNGCLSDDGTPLNPFDVPATKELFRCGGQVCPPGQDCITVDGTPRCADPCKHFSVLNDTWRANDHFEDLSDPHCDDEVAWQGWYRMYLGDVSIRMPERCQPIKMCGTHAPSFLVQAHPQVGDGVQKHTICATWENGCCKFHLNPIHVKACAGNYVVYKLVNPQDCRVAYCADVNTKVCATCGENEACVSEDKITYRCEKRAGNSVSEPADDGTTLNPFDVPATEELFRCGGQVCPPGQDCLTVDGTPRCADPCKHSSVLNDTWRANDHFEDLSDPHCDDDVDWMGWYRMYLGDVSVRMPERCQPIKMCGTHAPSFLVQPHPQVGDGVQKHTICATWENGCCKFHLNPIHVKACAGNFVVYKLVNPQDCRVAYCADVNTKVCATCGENEACVSEDKITYRCEKRAGNSVSEPADDGTTLNPFDVPATEELFRCGGQVCPPGQDCLTVDGTPRCADPCKHFSVLNDTWRANDHFEDLSDPHCDDDVDWMGWYRMYLGDVSVRMPERCQPIKMCGTHAPSFLVQPHPQVGDGVQKHTICATWENGCCKFHLNPIHVKACAGNFVVYKLVNPQDCRVAYCADVNTKVCAACAENEACVSDDKINYRCERAGKSVSAPTAEGTPLNPFDVPATEELFRCGGQVCPPGQDCISVDGTPSCADPCKHFSVLNDTWRANDHFEDLSDPHCDDEVAWKGWYRMYLGDVSIRMPERCQPIKMCGTHAPSFLVQPHPQVGDGVQKHTICATWENGCCKFHLNPIHVKACAGNYVVYKLVNPQDCRVAYCADVNTKVCATCTENEACVSDDKITYRCEKRAGKSVSAPAKDGTPLNPFDVPATKELFRCAGQVCPPGQDCISVGGAPRCADPCKHFSVLNDTWRANDHFEDLSDPHCDDEVAWQGWYRMYLGDVSIRMPERCQPIKMCGTHAPSFLVQPHPQVGDGVQKHTICATWENGCCKFHLNPIHVKACAGNYVVYKLVNPQDCRVAYCADVNTKVCASCAENEACVSDDKITYRCEKRGGKSVPEPADDGTPLNPFDVPAIKVLFRCSGQVCQPGQDCITVDGTARCADPCEHYSVLNDTWRANDHFEDLSDPHCDDEVNWQGWYRMYLGDVSVQMPERCQPIKMCGTHAPSFLVQPHPQVGDGVQKHTICATWENGCCKFHLNPIHVKACAGNYVVYKLVNPQDCRVAYCADVNTKVCATCGDNKACVSDDKINYRCEN